MQNIAEHRLKFFADKTKEYISKLPFVKFNRELQSIEYEYFAQRDLIKFKIRNDQSSIFEASIQGDVESLSWLCYTSPEGYFFELRDAIFDAITKDTKLASENKNTSTPNSLQNWFSPSRLAYCFTDFKHLVKIKHSIIQKFLDTLQLRLSEMKNLTEKKNAIEIQSQFTKELLDHSVFNGFRSNPNYLMPNSLKTLWDEFLDTSGINKCLKIKLTNAPLNSENASDGFYLVYEEILDPYLFVDFFDVDMNDFITFIAKKYDLMRKQRILGELDTSFMVFFLNEVSDSINTNIEGKNLIFPSFIFEGITNKQIYEEILC